MELAGGKFLLSVDYFPNALADHKTNVLFIVGVEYGKDSQLRALPPNDPKLIAEQKRHIDKDLMAKITGGEIGDDGEDYFIPKDGKPYIGSQIREEHKRAYQEIISDIGHALAQVARPK